MKRRGGEAERPRFYGSPVLRFSDPSFPEGGFSLIELLVVTALLVILTGSVFLLMSGGQKRFKSEENTKEAIQNARLALDVIVRMLKELGADPKRTANSGLVTIEPQRLRFTADLTGSLGDQGDSDGDVGDAYEDVTISFNGNQKTIYLDVSGSGPQPLAKDIKNLKFEYYTLDESTGRPVLTSDPTKVRKIRVIVEIEPEYENPELYRREGFKMVSANNPSAAFGVDVQLRNRRAFNPFSQKQ